MFRALILVLFLLKNSFSYSQTKPLPTNILRSIHERTKEHLNPSIVIGIVDREGTRFYSFGLNRKGGKKVNEHSIYEIGSISKIFTATLLADMVMKGEMETDDPISQYLPKEVTVPTYEGQSITLGHISDHSSSLPRMPDNFHPADDQNPYADYTIEQMYSFLSTVKLDRPIGSEYEYSNLGVGLLGNILALKAGTSYEKLLNKIITEPLQMKETKIVLNKNMTKHLAYGHHDGIEVANWDLPTMAGAGGIRSSAYDMLLFLKAQMQLTETPLRQAMLLTQQPRHSLTDDGQVGLGWHMFPTHNGIAIVHEGATGGYTSFVGFVKETGTGVVVLTNSNHAAADIGMHLLDPSSPLEQI
ncbi:MAG: beta-lactamase family protein, partial [Bacteroidota bacterium]|nr:beta-lactamase family protein [Bacteroidota bacterium]